MKTSIVLTFLIFATATTASAAATGGAPTLSLSEAVTTAEKDNSDLQRLKATAERVSWTKLEALSGYIPHISAGYDHFLISNYMREAIVFGGSLFNFPAVYPQDNITIDASWTVFDGLQSWHAYQAARLQSDAAQLDLSRAKFQTDEAVRSAFFEALAAQKLYEVAQQNVKTLDDHLRRANLTEKNGYGTKFDVIRIQATLDEAQAELGEAEGKYHDARDALSDVMGQEKNDGRALTGDLPILKDTDVPANLDLATADREDFEAQQKRDEASRHMSSASSSFWYPNISVFAEQQYYQFGNSEPLVLPNSSLQAASFVGLRLRWNLFDGGYSYAKEKEAAAAALESAAATHAVLIQVPRDFEMWKRNFYQSVALYKARSHALSQFEESVRLAEIGIRAGTRTHTEMLDAELDLFRARAGVVKAQADALGALGKLELAAGHKIWDDKSLR